jgi:hypothetical protein
MSIGWTYPTLYMSEASPRQSPDTKLTELELQLSPIPVLGSQVILGSRLARFSSILARKRRNIPSSTPHPATRDC